MEKGVSGILFALNYIALPTPIIPMSDQIYKVNDKSKIYLWLNKTVDVEPHELKALILSLLYFFSLLCSYYIIRPIRDEMGIAGGIENLQWLFTGTFVAMVALVPLFGWISSKYTRTKFIPYIYFFHIQPAYFLRIIQE